MEESITLEIELLKHPRLHERVLAAIMKVLGYGLGSLPLIPHLLVHGFGPSKAAFSQQSICYKEDDYRVWRHPKSQERLVKDYKNVTSLSQLLEEAVKQFPERKCLGKRRVRTKVVQIDRETGKELIKYDLGDYKWTTFRQLHSQVERISRSLTALGFNEENRIALFAYTSPEWLTMTFSCFKLGIPFITIYSTLSNEEVAQIFKKTQVYGVFVDEKTCPRVLELLGDAASIKYIIVGDYVEGSSRELAQPTCESCKVLSYYSLLECTGVDELSGLPFKEKNDLALIMFTSGSSGVPKGVMISHNNLLSVLAFMVLEEKFSATHVYLAFLPSAHIFEFFFEVAVVSVGSAIGFGLPLTLFDTSPMVMEGSKGDLTTLQPTMMIAVPLLLERLKKTVLQKLTCRSRFKQLLFQTAYNMKLFYRKLGFKTPVLDALVFKPLRGVFGGRLEFAFVGGAPISRDTEEFTNICFGEFKQGYGLTETCAAVSFNNFGYMATGSAGRPTRHCEIKLMPWPEGNCNPLDEKRPVGEVAICGGCVTLGYYKEEELTAENFQIDPKTSKRWFFTGDIGTFLPDGTLRIIDRKKDIIKLLDGEYLSLANLEEIMKKEFPYADYVCLGPSKDMSHLVAIIVPNFESCKKILLENGQMVEGEATDVVLAKESVKQFFNEYSRRLVFGKLKRHAMPSAFHVINEVWVPGDKTVTPTAKIRRKQICEKYPFFFE